MFETQITEETDWGALGARKKAWMHAPRAKLAEHYALIISYPFWIEPAFCAPESGNITALESQKMLILMVERNFYTSKAVKSKTISLNLLAPSITHIAS